MANNKQSRKRTTNNKSKKKKNNSIVKATEKGISAAKEQFDNLTERIDISKVLSLALKTSGIRIDRKQYLQKELIKYFPQETVDLAIRYNPAYAGIPRRIVSKIADQSITLETTKVVLFSSGISLVSPLNVVPAVTADLSQYFAFIIRALQKLAYLYGFKEFDISDQDSIDDETMSEIIVFMGVMFGVNGASTALSKIAEKATETTAKRIAAQHLTKGTIYPIVKTVLKSIGYHINKQAFADSVANMIPLASSVLSGGVTFFAFKPCCYRLKRVLEKMNISDPNHYHRPYIN